MRGASSEKHWQEGRQPSLPLVMEGAPASNVTGSKPAAQETNR